MGNSESSFDTRSNIEIDETDIYQSTKNNYYINRYNLVPSYRNNTYETVSNAFLRGNNPEVPDYVDLRKSFPNIINVGQFPFNPIACISYLLEYSLLKNDLTVFPPSLMFIYKHCNFFNGTPQLLSFETIFKAIRHKGFCIENEFRTNKQNLNTDTIPDKIYEKALPYKFIKIYSVDQNIETIKAVLSNKYPILVGFSVFYKFSKISNKLWVPNHNLESNIGGLGGVIVGYIHEREVFIMAQTYGNNFGQSGYIMVPYKYILNPNYTFEMYVLDVDKKRVDGYLNQTAPLIEVNEKETSEKNNGGGIFSNLFG